MFDETTFHKENNRIRSLFQMKPMSCKKIGIQPKDFWLFTIPPKVFWLVACKSINFWLVMKLLLLPFKALAS
jgi:hypothetical protein